MLQIFDYNPKGGYQFRRCEICGLMRWCCQHHLDLRKNSDEIIWICSNMPDRLLYSDACHSKVHNPISFNLPSSWAYDNGYLRKSNMGKGVATQFKKKSTKKGCKHKAIYVPSLKCWKCLFCTIRLSEKEVEKYI